MSDGHSEVPRSAQGRVDAPKCREAMAPSLVHSLEIVCDVLQFICVWLSRFS